VQRNVAEKKFLQAIGGWKEIRAQKNCPTPPPQKSNGPSLSTNGLGSKAKPQRQSRGKEINVSTKQNNYIYFYHATYKVPLIVLYNNGIKVTSR
jgi:hypothetical protein